MPGSTVEPTTEISSNVATAENRPVRGADEPPDPEASNNQEVNSSKAATEEQLAACFANTFEPTENVGYGWVCDYAKDRFNSTLLVLKDLEDKASSAITFLGSGVGLLTMGAALAIANPSNDRSVVACSVPSILFALAALVFAFMGRRTVGVPFPPPIEDAIRLANYAVNEQKGKVLFAAQLHVCVTMLEPVLARKAFWVDWCLRLAVVSLVMLLLPLFVALSISKKAEEPKPMHVMIDNQAVTVPSDTK